jgi:hypothetical protein
MDEDRMVVGPDLEVLGTGLSNRADGGKWAGDERHLGDVGELVRQVEEAFGVRGVSTVSGDGRNMVVISEVAQSEVVALELEAPILACPPLLGTVCVSLDPRSGRLVEVLAGWEAES